MTVHFFHQVRDVAAGHGFSVFAAQEDEHKAFGTGLNSDSQLGEQLSPDNVPLKMLIRPAPISLPLFSSEYVVKVACGRLHSLFLTNNGRGKQSITFLQTKLYI